jgi:hypothetical protein
MTLLPEPPEIESLELADEDMSNNAEEQTQIAGQAFPDEEVGQLVSMEPIASAVRAKWGTTNVILGVAAGAYLFKAFVFPYVKW